jgi:hypothetical protein
VNDQLDRDGLEPANKQQIYRAYIKLKATRSPL